MRVLVSKDFVITNTPGFGSSVMINGISVEDEDAYSYRSSGYSPCKKFIVFGGEIKTFCPVATRSAKSYFGSGFYAE